MDILPMAAMDAFRVLFSVTKIQNTRKGFCLEIGFIARLCCEYEFNNRILFDLTINRSIVI